jgi:hypothetical protein
VSVALRSNFRGPAYLPRNDAQVGQHHAVVVGERLGEEAPMAAQVFEPDLRCLCIRDFTALVSLRRGSGHTSGNWQPCMLTVQIDEGNAPELGRCLEGVSYELLVAHLVQCRRQSWYRRSCSHTVSTVPSSCRVGAGRRSGNATRTL